MLIHLVYRYVSGVLGLQLDLMVCGQAAKIVHTSGAKTSLSIVICPNCSYSVVGGQVPISMARKNQSIHVVISSFATIYPPQTVLSGFFSCLKLKWLKARLITFNLSFPFRETRMERGQYLRRISRLVHIVGATKQQAQVDMTGV